MQNPDFITEYIIVVSVVLKNNSVFDQLMGHVISICFYLSLADTIIWFCC